MNQQSMSSSLENVGAPAAAEASPEAPMPMMPTPASGDSVENLPNLEEVMELQPTINIGTLGHVSHGKTTVVKTITGVDPIKFSKEKIRNITIKLGYANVKIFKCETCFGHGTAPSSHRGPLACPSCRAPMPLVRHVSFVDCPGHDMLMSTMMTGAAVMDAALLVIAGNAPCPQPQTQEHLVAAEIMGLERLLVVQNKIDLVTRETAMENYGEIMKFTKGTAAASAPVIPVSAQRDYNMDILLESIAALPAPDRDMTAAPRMVVIRSFDVNRPGTVPDDLKGGVAGGSVLRGVFRRDQLVEVRPGIVRKTKSGEQIYQPIVSNVVSLMSEQTPLTQAVPGGLIAMGLNVDPSLTRNDLLVGQMIGAPGTLPGVYTTLAITKITLLRRVVGAQGEALAAAEKVTRFTVGETVLVCVGSMSAEARVSAVKVRDREHNVQVVLSRPTCVDVELSPKVAISRRVDKHWRLSGFGTVTNGKAARMSDGSEPASE